MNIVRDKVKRDSYMCNKLCAMIRREELRKDHKQQRRPDQWTNETRDNFIVTAILNEDFDPIKICEQIVNENIVYLWLIDGLQKSSYLTDFRDGKFKLGKNIDPSTIEYQQAKVDENGMIATDDNGDPIYETVSFNLVGKGYKDLPEKLKEDFDNCPVHYVKHLNCTDKEIARHIVRYNSGKPMVANQKLATYVNVEIAKYIKKIADHSFFNDCANYSSTTDKNGTIDRIVAETIMGINFLDSWTKNIRKLAKLLDEKATKEMFDTLNDYLDRLMEVVTPETGKLFSPKNAHIFLMVFDKFSKMGLPDEQFQDFLEEFENFEDEKFEVENEYELTAGSDDATSVISYAELNSLGGTKNINVIKDKLFIIESLMNEYLHIGQTEETKPEVAGDVIGEDLFDTESVEESSEKPVIAEVTEYSAIGNKEIEHVEGEVVDSDTLDFVKEYVDDSVDDVDLSYYEDDLDTITKDVDSKLLDEANRKSLIAIIAYAYIQEENYEEWMKDYFNRNNTYEIDQKRNYLNMRNDLIRFNKGAVA